MDDEKHSVTKYLHALALGVDILETGCRIRGIDEGKSLACYHRCGLRREFEISLAGVIGERAYALGCTRTIRPIEADLEVIVVRENVVDEFIVNRLVNQRSLEVIGSNRIYPTSISFVEVIVTLRRMEENTGVSRIR